MYEVTDLRDKLSIFSNKGHVVIDIGLHSKII